MQHIKKQTINFLIILILILSETKKTISEGTPNIKNKKRRPLSISRSGLPQPPILYREACAIAHTSLSIGYCSFFFFVWKFDREMSK